MKINFIVLIMMLWLIFACSEDEVLTETEEQVVLTIESAENLNLTDVETWVIISNKAGNTLTSGRLTSDSSFTTKSLVEDYINVTLVKDWGENYVVTTYTEIPVNDTWFMPAGPQAKTGADSEKTVKLKNMFINTDNNFFYYSISSQYGNAFSEGGSQSGSQMYFAVRMPETAPNDILFVLNDGIADPKYTWLSENDFVENQVELDYLIDLTPVDQILYYSFPEVSSVYMDITAYNQEKPFSFKPLEGYIQSEFFPFHLEETSPYRFKVGYLEGFDYYKSRMTIKIAGKSYYYEKFGGPPEAFDESFFDSDFELVNDDPSAFQYTATGDFDVASGFWSGNEDKPVNWYIYYPIDKDNANVVIKDLPKNIIDRFPDLNLRNLDYNKATFIDIIEGGAYSSFIANQFKNEDGSNVVEQYSLSR